MDTPWLARRPLKFHRFMVPWKPFPILGRMSERQYGMRSDVRVGNDIYELPGHKMYSRQRGSCSPCLLAYFLEVPCIIRTDGDVCIRGHTELLHNAFWKHAGPVEVTKHLLRDVLG